MSQDLRTGPLGCPRMPRPLQIDEIVQAGLCIGCGLCESIAGPERVALVTTADGRERPLARTRLDARTTRAINAVCPGTRIDGADPSRMAPGIRIDPVWGPLGTLVLGHATDAALRHRAASGGVLSALAQFMLSSGRVELVLHVAPSRQAPMRSTRHLSFDRVDVLEACGSRYGPAAPLRDFGSVLARGRPFALIGKPCDVGAVRNLTRVDPRVDELMRYALSMICGGASELGKSQDVLDRFGVAQRDLVLFRYRGHGNPGRTRIETRDGRVHELTYDEMWEDEATWRIQSRCKICPDAIGEAADIVAGDTWPDATPGARMPGSTQSSRAPRRAPSCSRRRWQPERSRSAGRSPRASSTTSIRTRWTRSARSGHAWPPCAPLALPSRASGGCGSAVWLSRTASGRPCASSGGRCGGGGSGGSASEPLSKRR